MSEMKHALLLSAVILALACSSVATAHAPWQPIRPSLWHYQPPPPLPPPHHCYPYVRTSNAPRISWREPAPWRPPLSTSCWTARGMALLPRPLPVGSACSAVTAWGAIDRGIVR